MGRSYGQYCGLARALEVVGDRWNLLIVRQLLIAPARYQELREGLPGMATNLLADRLRDLEAAGVLERRLANDGNAITYALTTWGAQLREPIEGLIRWSTPLMIRGPQGDTFRADGLLVALPALFHGRAPADRPTTVGITVHDDTDRRVVQVRATHSGIEVNPHDDRELDAVLSADAPIILGLAAGVLALADVLGLVDIQGDEAAVRAIFGAPATPSP
ncbi:winged helix-turn-helix transcriptional regulator [Mycobacterium talmoniae]|uniref:Transcriptional regulator n=1 Tax=Mycobacterium talmoniae TaxID=1858794 RepID=A0A1S1NQ51_9MYCO|nr:MULTISPECIES: helix-turn-helix domain-containing protein [Mycobacterium]OHV06637.1 transcriptional regulator [Mycobacterium talmoniae]TDH50870.1 transcriptional regulator [Mycobacterium eburneum]